MATKTTTERKEIATDVAVRNAVGELVSILVRRHALPLVDANAILEKLGMTLDNQFSFGVYNEAGERLE